MWYLFLWRDIVQIIFFSIFFYRVSLWLKKDTCNNLLWYVVMYALFVALSFVLQLTMIHSFLFIYSPVIAMLFILIHQETLQKNFVVQKNHFIQSINSHDWLDTLLSSCLLLMHQNKPTICIIQQKDDLTPFITSSFFLNAPINNTLLEMLYKSDSYDDNKACWITSNGIIKGVNSEWKEKISEPIKTSSIDMHDNFEYSISTALIITQKTDALFFFINPITRLFTIIINDTVFKKINAHGAQHIIKKHIMFISTVKQKGSVYEDNLSSIDQYNA